PPHPPPLVEGRRGFGPSWRQLPWWLILLVLLFLITLFSMLNSTSYLQALSFIAEGLEQTIMVSLVAYAISLVLGLLIGLGRVSKHPITYNLATLYVELMRGVPLLVIILYTQFVLMPWLGSALGLPRLVRETFITAVVAL